MIERYLKGDMNQIEKNDFEDRLRHDAKLAEAFEHTKTAHQFIHQAGRLDLKKKLASFDEEIEQEEKRVFPMWVKRAISVAAVLLISIGIYQFFIKESNTKSTGEIYAEYFTGYSGPGVLRNSNQDLPHWKEATKLYYEKKYEEAIPNFEKAKAPPYASSFYIGLSHMLKDTPNFEEAIGSFNVVLESNNDFFHQALWYKGLSLLKLKEKEKASAIFKSVRANKQYKFKEAEEIIKLLKE